jgi:hypothetical protein
MNRRTFFQRLLGGLGLITVAPAVATVNRAVLIQESPVAGFQFHEGEFVWPSLKVGKELTLVREADNVHDSNAVAVYFNMDQVGYVPRVENTAVAQMLDRGEHLKASISKLNDTDDPWDRIWLEIFLA